MDAMLWWPLPNNEGLRKYINQNPIETCSKALMHIFQSIGLPHRKLNYNIQFALWILLVNSIFKARFGFSEPILKIIKRTDTIIKKSHYPNSSVYFDSIPKKNCDPIILHSWLRLTRFPGSSTGERWLYINIRMLSPKWTICICGLRRHTHTQWLRPKAWNDIHQKHTQT